MQRFIDYFLVIGVDEEKQKRAVIEGKILCKLPEQDWDDESQFIDENLALFCQPLGWTLTVKPVKPTFFVSVLTDIKADRHYCACLSFSEPISIKSIKHYDDEDLDYSQIIYQNNQSTMYAPKCLVLVSKFHYIDVLKNCLSIIFTVYAENRDDVSLETIIGNLLACVEVPQPGEPEVEFSLGANDLQYLQSPLDPQVPNTGIIVYQLFEQLGIHTVLTLFTAIMTEHKVLIHSQSFSRLHDACQALISLIYPFKYSHVYIPLLPTSLTEVLNIPTPFLIGCHSKLKSEFEDALIETIIVDLDCGRLSLPDFNLPCLDLITYNELANQLCLIIKPQSVTADNAFSFNDHTYSQSPPHLLDKEIRAIFLRFIAQVLSGYRNFLQVVRIFPKPFITFHKTLFLGTRNLVENEFTVKLINSMFFNTFIQERGPPYRYVDLFDNLCADIHDILVEEEKNSSLFLHNIRSLANKLLDNEFTLNENNPNVKVLKPSKEAIERTTRLTFPIINKKCILEKIENEAIKKEMTQSLVQQKSLTKLQLVPFGAKLSLISSNESNIMNNSAKRLEVMKNCITCIFEKRITDARKTFPAVLGALKNKFARLALAQELLLYITDNGGIKAELEHEQFDLVVKLMNSALQQDTNYLNVENATTTGLLSTAELGDVNGLATAILPLSRTFCRRLNTGIIQFAYSCLQDHAVWSRMSFWESAFYTDAEKDLISLYGLNKNEVDEEHYHRLVLEKTAEQMQLSEMLSESEINERSKNEESTVYSQAIHYSNHMVYLKIPLDICDKIEKVNRHSKYSNHFTEGHSDTNSTNPTGTVARRDSFLDRDLENESGYEDANNSKFGIGSNSERSLNAIKYIDRFIDKVAIEAGISEEHIKSLHTLVPSIVALQCETNDIVYKESKKLPPITKSKLVAPYLLPGERIVAHCLRAYLVDNCRDEGIDSHYTESINNGIDSTINSSVGLPAEGGLFLTNYRIIFRGKSWDPLASENCIVRFFPIATLCKEKRISFSSHTFASIDQYLTEGLQLRSNAFQAFTIAFDEEVNSVEIEQFCKTLNKTRSPSNLFLLFAFTSQSPTSNQIELLTLQSKKDKGGTLRFARKTLSRAVEKTGINVNRNKKNKEKYSNIMLNNLSGSKTMLNPKTPVIIENDERFNDNASVKSDPSHLFSTNSASMVSNDSLPVLPTIYREKDSRTLRKLVELPYVRDYQRLELGNSKILLNTQINIPINSPIKQFCKEFRISIVNINYNVTQTYPAFVVVPANLNDESIKKLSKCFKSQRFPAIVWKHPKKKSLLIRASAFHGKGVINLFKSHGPSSNMSSNLSTGNQNDSAAFEQEKYFKSILTLTPINTENLNSYSASINSLEILSVNEQFNTFAKESRISQNQGFSSISKALNTLRTSGGKSGLGTIGHNMGKKIQKWNNKLINQDVDSNSQSSTITEKSQSSQNKITNINGGDSISNTAAIGVLSLGLDNKFVNFYIFMEKLQTKNLKIEQFPSACAFVPVEVHDIKQTKQSFKKLLKICCPMSKSKTESKHGFYHQIESSGWFGQLQTILTIANEIVDVVDYKGCSAMLCLEESADIVPQIISIAELCLDPHYRTFLGFRVLIEKEWLAFGHRFSHRSNQVGPSTSVSSFTPIFLQFLDLVHQIINQYPLSFEFNQYYLKFIAYHYISCRFRTFLLDSEAERADYGWLYEDLRKNEDNFDFLNGSNNLRPPPHNNHLPKSAQTYLDSGINFIGASFWDWAENLWEKSSIFFNFYYVASSIIENSSDEKNPRVLRPKINLNNFRVWDYYLSEELSHGPSYDVEMVTFEKQRREEQEATGPDNTKNKENKRIIVNPINENVTHFQPNGIEEMLELICMLEAELGKGNERNWHKLWDNIEITMSSTKKLSLNNSDSKISISNQILRRYNNINMHTINNFLNNQKQHRFEKFTYTSLVVCDYCKINLFDIIKTGLKCRECGYNTHERCFEQASKTKCLGNNIRSFVNHSMDQDDDNSLNSPDANNLDNNNLHHHYKQFLENNLGENQTYAGYLNKRGVLLKSWKQSWFVLDSIKHQLRYYETKEASYSKGFIDLAEVASISLQICPDNNMFELKTIRRNYSFMAPDSATAKDWVDKIQACLQ